MKQPSKVVIYVQHGVVESVETDDKDLEILVLDYDTKGVDDKYLELDSCGEICMLGVDATYDPQSVRGEMKHWKESGKI